MIVSDWLFRWACEVFLMAELTECACGHRDMRIVMSDASSGSKLLAVLGHDGEGDCICEHDNRGNCKAVLDGCPVTGHSKEVLGVAISPDGTIIASASEDWWLRSLDRHQPAFVVWNISLEPISRSVCLWCAGTGELKRRIAYPGDAPGTPVHFNSARSVRRLLQTFVLSKFAEALFSDAQTLR